MPAIWEDKGWDAVVWNRDSLGSNNPLLDDVRSRTAAGFGVEVPMPTWL